jgi:hypothetical protein
MATSRSQEVSNRAPEFGKGARSLANQNFLNTLHYSTNHYTTAWVGHGAHTVERVDQTMGDAGVMVRLEQASGRDASDAEGIVQ